MTSLHVVDAAMAGRLEQVSFSASPGHLIAIVGPNGGGKTSLLRAIGGVEQALGTIMIGQERLAEVNEARRRALVAFLPASRDFHWPIPARDILAMGGNCRDEALIEDLIDQLELRHIADRPVDRLSTGERTRVLFGRCLAARPVLHLLDEPLSNLDPHWVLRFIEMMKSEVARGAIILASVHDLSTLSHFDRVIVVSDGKVQMDETPEALMDSERFGEIFRIRRDGADWTINRPEDPQSSL